MDLYRLRERWQDEGVTVLDGLPAAALDAFEVRNGVALPADFRVFYRTMNGMGPDCSDHDLVRFWPLSELREARGFSSDCIEEGVFVFADWAIHACVYGISLRDGAFGVGHVVEACGGKVVAGSFREFVEANLLSSCRSWPPGG